MQKCSATRVDSENDDVSLLLDNIPELETFFKIRHRIGHGTFSSVYLGEAKSSHFGTRKHYAIKHIIPTSHPSRIYMELKCLKLIGGKSNVIEATCCLRNLNHIVIAMPYVPHDSFIDYIGKLTVNELGLYLYNLFLALSRVHSFNIIHRDIKPANFLYSRKFKRYTLVDFGLAQDAASSSNKQISPPLIETPQLNCSQRVKRKLTVSSPENLNSKKVCQSSSSFSNQSSTSKSGSVFSPASNRFFCNVPFVRKSPRKHSNISSRSPPKKMTSYNKPVPATPLRTLNDSPSKHTRLAEALWRYPYSQSKPLREQFVRDSFVTSENNFEGFVPMVENSRRSGMDASLSVISQVGNQSSNFSSGRLGSTLHEVKTKSGKSVLCSSSCGCYGSSRVCAVCLARKNERAPRAGTPGFRAPEVLLRHPKQTTAVDMWSAGVMLLCLLSGKYPFFRAVDDTLSLAEIATILGTKVMKKAAATLEKLFTCSEEKPTLDLMKICETMLAGAKNGITTSSCDGKSIFDFKCDRCKQKYDCVCLLSSINARTSNGYCVYSPNSFNIGDRSLPQTDPKLSQMYFNDGKTCNSSGEHMYPTLAYDLLSRLLDPNPATRISADDALKHPFVLPYVQ